MRRPFILLLCAANIVIQGAISGQTPKANSSLVCETSNQFAVRYAEQGRSQEAESLLFRDLQELERKRSGAECVGLVLNNLAAIMLSSGKLAKAEILAERSVDILEKSYSRKDPVLLRPLQILSAARFEQGKIGKAREAFQKMREIPSARLEDQALVHGIAAALLQAEGRLKEAESEYLVTISAWEGAGRGNTASAGTVVSQLGSLYIEEHRFEEAQRLLDRAWALFTSAEDTVAMDRIKLLNNRATLHARQGQWREAGEDLRVCILMVDREAHVDPVAVATLLSNYAATLRKNHRKGEARSIEVRAAALRGHTATNMLVDVTELIAESKLYKK
ncbi:MAG: tetratricopeptide repeat protein [Bryobacteraceae bacterium]